MTTDGKKAARDQVVRMDNLIMDDLFSMSDEELLREAAENGIDVAAVGVEGQKAFERAQQIVGRNRLALVRQEMSEDEKKSPIPVDREKAQSEVNAILARNREMSKKLTMAARNEAGELSDDMDGILDDFVELGAIAQGGKDKDA